MPLPAGKGSILRDGFRIRTLEWSGDCLLILDQRLLPGREEYIPCRDVGTLAEAIRTLAVRGAPAIGIAAAYGAVLAAGAHGAAGREDIVEALDLLGSTRPTAVNLFHAIDMQKRVISACSDPRNLRSELLASADRLLQRDLEASRIMGALGAGLLPAGCRLLTHCNAGGLATGGLGTALAVFYEAWDRGILERAYADETRPLLQGARLTAWELSRAGIPVTVLPDSAAASLLASGEIDAVFTGADRIAANGDTANKIGTYPLALAAMEAGVPFYVVAPLSTFDPATGSGGMICIEQRDGAEVAGIQGVRTAPEGVAFHNPAFDVTPARLVTAWICEAGVIGHPFRPEVPAEPREVDS